MKRILVPTDFSESANKALEMAVNIAELNHSEVNLVHFVEALDHPEFMTSGENVSNPMDHVFMIKLIDKVKSKISRLAEKHTSRATVVARVEFGNVSKSLFKLLKEEEFELVIMGSKGNSDWDNLMLGSNTNKMVRVSDIPILLVPHNAKVDTIRDLVIATNSEEDAAEFFALIKNLQKIFFAHLHLLRAITISDFYTDKEVKKELQKFAKDYQLEDYSIHHYNADSIEEGVINYANDINAGLVAIVSHKRSIVGNMFGSISSDISNHSNVPVLILNVERPNKHYDVD